MRNRRLLVGAGGVLCFALALRLGPLYWSPLPFNPDGLGYAGMVRDALDAGQFELGEMATDQVGFTALLAVVAALVGDPVLTVAQPTSALVGAVTVLAAVVFGYRLAADAGWTHSRAVSAGLVAGLLLSLEGVYLYRSMPTDEQTAGLLLVPVVALAVDRWLRSGTWQWGAVATVLVVPIPPLHNLTGLITAITVTLVGGIAVVRTPTRSNVTRAVAGTVLTWGYAIGYHVVVERHTAAAIVQAERLVSVPGLFAAWIVVALLASVWFLTTSSRLQRGAVVGGFAVVFGLVGLNAVRTVFPSTTATPRPLLLALLPLAVPALLAGLVAHVAPRSRSAGGATVALVAAACAVVGTALTARLTFEYLALTYRSQLFVHLPLLALAGVGTVTVLGADRDRRAAGLVVLVVLCTVASAPVAYAGLEMRTYKSVTSEAEFAATAYASAEFASWASDDHLGRVAGYHGGNGQRRPVYEWLRNGDEPPQCPVLAQASWTTVGAQFHPQPPATISDRRYRDWRARNDVVYAVDTDDPLQVVVPRTNATAC